MSANRINADHSSQGTDQQATSTASATNNGSSDQNNAASTNMNHTAEQVAPSTNMNQTAEQSHTLDEEEFDLSAAEEVTFDTIGDSATDRLPESREEGADN
ncbi:hypothetical protein, variant 3 [Exophiala oligosperma]|nr:hypothetical protein, variant 1 [Exophiala oligosperma]XP_016256026.1 hypothetical protein, variant 2 [Exophiala oligosperma]XP_016256027.1 hypothetical protein, variant 3 [Exophiala oligosperma]KIW35809.1 hypothetical protein, variant 1 [Exophiala oligosperma]KIW35810.1 hypothetical protein, variant 2 [Exophiala oligosperma]KIW35811.1 hypothetical protein, variant 3 [Exophiala oligosperma]